MMYKILLLFLISPLLSSGQIQIGQDINGEFPGDQSGWSVSSSADGNIVAIGAPRNGVNGINSGHVRIFKYNGVDSWEHLGQDIDGEASEDVSGDFNSISLSDDGQIIAIGAFRNDGNGDNSGHVRVFQYNGVDTWLQLGEDIDGESSGDGSGISVSLSAKGNIVAIGALFNDNDNGNNSGHVRVFTFNGTNWIQIGQDLDGETTNEWLGKSVSLSDDGYRVAIGAPFALGSTGYFKVYQYTEKNIWEQLGERVEGATQTDRLAWSMSMSGDGNRIVVGAPDNGENGTYSGQVRVYEYNGVDAWEQIGEDINGELEDFAGQSVSLSSNGQIMAVGYHGNGDYAFGAGKVKLFIYEEGNWSQLGNDMLGQAEFDIFGRSVAISSNGRKVVVGANGSSANGNSSGQARVFDLSLLSVPNYEDLPMFNIFPNPANKGDKVSIVGNSIIKKVSVYNHLGQFVESYFNNTLTTVKLSSGVYFIQIETSDDIILTKKLIIE